MATVASIPDYVQEFLEPMWIELCFVVCFSLGWLVVRWKSGVGDAVLRKPKHLRVDTTSSECKESSAAAAKLHMRIEEAASTGQAADVVQVWREATGVALSSDILRLVVKALVTVSPGSLVAEMTEHIERHAASLCNAKTAFALLDALAASGDTACLEDMHASLSQHLGIYPTYQAYEALLGGHAAAGNEARVLEIISEIHQIQQKLTARGHALVIKGFLTQGLLDAALRQVRVLLKQGFYIPPFAITMFVRVASEVGRTGEIVEALWAEAKFPTEAILCLLDDCVRRGDLQFANRLERLARTELGWGSAGNPVPHGAYSSLLKVNASAANIHAIELFEEMQSSGARISEGLCTAVLSRCAETKFLRFAEEVVQVLRARDGMTITVYSALMKVYAHCGLHGRACDLYDEIMLQGLEPDNLMYTCLMRFAVEAGRIHLLDKLSATAPQLDTQTCMLLIQSAGRSKDVDRAFAVLQRMDSTGLAIDSLVYNCVLDACACAGDLARARTVVQKMRSLGFMDIVTHNIMLKVFCAAGDVNSAWEVFAEIRRDGFKPNDISYNCMINVTASSGNFAKAWELVEMMQEAGVGVDRYTVSTIMKALKRNGNKQYVKRAFELLDHAGLDVCMDGVLLNTAIDFCVRHSERRRLQALLTAWERSGQQPDLRICSALIKAYSVLHDVGKCWCVWEQLTERRGMQPNDITLGCMLDALVTNGLVSNAVDLFRRWKTPATLKTDQAAYNMVLYSTLIKGFAAEGRTQEAMDMLREMRLGACRMNVVVYNTLIDVQARIGAVDAIQELWKAMEQDHVAPDLITFATMMKGYCMQGNLDRALEVFREVQVLGMATDCVIYNTFLDGCTRNARMDLADLVLEDMERNRIKPSNFTLGILVKMYGRRRQLDKAFEVITSYAAAHYLQPNMQVKTCLISGCISNNDLERAMEVFEDMKASSEEAMDARAFNVMVSAFVRAGRLAEAVRIVEEGYGLGGGRRRIAAKQDISVDALQNLLRALGRQGLQEKWGKPLLEKLRAAEVPHIGCLLATAMASTKFEH